MFTKKEAAWIIIAVIILGFIIGFSEKPSYSPIVFAIAFIIILANTLAKNLAAKYFFIEIKHKIWHFQRYGIYERAHLKKPFPIGLILPFFLAFLSLGAIKIMTLLQFTAKPSKKRILKKRGRIRKSEVNESDLAFTAAWGFYALIIIAIIGAIFKSPDLTKYSIYYGLWNLAPIGRLDGSKLFFGSFLNWVLLTAVYLIGLVVVLI